LAGAVLAGVVLAGVVLEEEEVSFWSSIKTWSVPVNEYLRDVPNGGGGGAVVYLC
jgi:hypothetical protein